MDTACPTSTGPSDFCAAWCRNAVDSYLGHVVFSPFFSLTIPFHRVPDLRVTPLPFSIRSVVVEVFTADRGSFLCESRDVITAGRVGPPSNRSLWSYQLFWLFRLGCIGTSRTLCGWWQLWTCTWDTLTPLRLKSLTSEIYASLTRPDKENPRFGQFQIK